MREENLPSRFPQKTDQVSPESRPACRARAGAGDTAPFVSRLHQKGSLREQAGGRDLDLVSSSVITCKYLEK